MPPFLIHFLSLCPQPQEEILGQPVLRVLFGLAGWDEGAGIYGRWCSSVAGATLVVLNTFSCFLRGKV